MIEIEHLGVCFGAYQALEDISLCIRPGEFVLITGPSGCGKSTLARCLNGLIPHTLVATLTGRVVVEGRETIATPVAELATRVGLVFQNPSTQLFNLTVAEEVAFGPRNLGLDEAEVERRVRQALEVVGMAELRGRSIRALSRGERQCLAIAAVLAMGPRILVLDEPTSSLDVTSTLKVMEALARLSAEGTTIIVIEHRLGQVAQLARRAILMDEGKVVADGTATSVFSDHALLRRLGLRRPAPERQEDWAALLRPNSLHSGVPIVEMEKIEAGYGSQKVLRGLNLSLYPGEFAALVGDNGAGKSTLALVLAGLLKPKRGTVRIGSRGKTTVARQVGLLFQNPVHQLFCDTVEEEVAFGPRNYGCLNPDGLQEIFSAMGLSELRWRRVAALSCGQQQRTALAAALSVQPEVVILDEPTLGQDWRRLSAFMDLLVQLNQSGTTILLITHDYKLVHRYAHRVLLMRDGQIAADGVPATR